MNKIVTRGVNEVDEVGLGGGPFHDKAHGHHLEADATLLLVQPSVREAHRPLVVPPLVPDLVRLLYEHVHHLPEISTAIIKETVCASSN